LRSGGSYSHHLGTRLPVKNCEFPGKAADRKSGGLRYQERGIKPFLFSPFKATLTTRVTVKFGSQGIGEASQKPTHGFDLGLIVLIGPAGRP
jgi:hypothetical protein